MSIPVALLNDTRIVLCDERTGGLGGSFYNNPHLQPYSPLPLRWCFDQLIRYEHATLIDVGASTGCFTLLSALHPDLTVHAFEPVDLTRRVLGENVYLNDLIEKVVVNRLGVSNYDGVGTMHVVNDEGGLGVSILNGEPAYHKKTHEVQIPVVTLDTYCEQYSVKPTFIKIDVEGQEKWVLEGARKTIEKYKPFLLYEYSQENCNQFGITARDTIEMIESWGYTWVSDGIDVQAVPHNWETIIR